MDSRDIPIGVEILTLDSKPDPLVYNPPKGHCLFFISSYLFRGCAMSAPAAKAGIGELLPPE